jgi:hypothetical protein
VAVATAATPLFVVHARIFKEDIFVATFLLLALAMLIRLLQEPAPHRAILLGPLIGCAAGSKYIGALILPSPFWPCPRPHAGTGAVGAPCAISIGTFLLIMLPAVRRLNRWRIGVKIELSHSIQGH